jgi:shikimate kinase
MPETWTLIGMMGSGKSSVGKALAQISGRKFQDTDVLIQQKLGRTIDQLFAYYGEEAFREHEQRTIESLQADNVVLATGGGVPMREANWNHLQKLGPLVYLKVSPEKLVSRLQFSRKKRPLLANDDWEDRLINLLEQRNPVYSKATIVHEVEEESPNETAEIVYQKLLEVSQL